MKKLANKLGFHKSEAERTRTQKIVRDIVFFGVVVYSAVMTFMFFNIETHKTEVESQLASSSITASQLTFSK